jgi:hypothetical protein
MPTKWSLIFHKRTHGRMIAALTRHTLIDIGYENRQRRAAHSSTWVRCLKCSSSSP